MILRLTVAEQATLRLGRGEPDERWGYHYGIHRLGLGAPLRYEVRDRDRLRLTAKMFLELVKRGDLTVNQKRCFKSVARKIQLLLVGA